MPDTEGLHLGISILYKLLEFHPPCKKGMHHIYSKVSVNFFIFFMFSCLFDCYLCSSINLFCDSFRCAKIGLDSSSRSLMFY